jgi:hypothetical protein
MFYLWHSWFRASRHISCKMTNKMQLCRIIYYSLVPWLFYMYRAIISLETCKTTKELGNNKLYYTVASCWSFYKKYFISLKIGLSAICFISPIFNSILSSYQMLNINSRRLSYWFSITINRNVIETNITKHCRF